VWLHGEVKTPPFSQAGRIAAGVLLRRLQWGERLGLPALPADAGSRPRCHELRIQNEQVSWRVVYRIDPDAIVVAAVFAKKTQHTPQGVIVESQRRLRRYDGATGEEDRG
jgi:phage-related protein